jgi:bacterial/archaeal transporter family protein
MWWVFALLSAFFAALTTILGKVGVQQVNSNLATAIRTGVVLVLAWGIVLSRGEQSGLTGIPQRTLLFLLLSGIATGLSWLCYFRALQLGQASQVAPIDKSSLVMTILLAAVFLGEPLNVKTVCGALLIVAGTLVLLF